MKTTQNSMMNCFRLMLAALVALIFVGCSADVDSELGYDIIPDHQKMEMRHLTFKGGKMLKFNASASNDEQSVYDSVDGHFFRTSLYRTDSLRSSNLSNGYIGIENSDTFGMRSAALASSIIFMNSVDSETGFGYKPIFDTLSLILTVTDYGVDTLTPVKYEIYELTKPLLGSIVNAADTTAYTNCDMSAAYDASKPLFTFTFPDGEKTGPTTTSIDLTPVNMSTERNADGTFVGQTWDFVRRLMLIPDDYDTNRNWDGYARDTEELYSDELKWQQKFHGIYIKPVLDGVDKSKRGAIYSFDLKSSGLQLQGRNRNPKDPTLIQDTIGSNYYFYDESIYSYTDSYGVYYEGVAEKGVMNISANKIEHDYSGSLLEGVKMDAYDESGNVIPNSGRDEVAECFVEGMAGVGTELYFTDEFLAQLKSAYDNEADDSKYRAIGVNQCRLYIYIKEASYVWEDNMSNAPELTKLMNSYLSRLGSYTNYSKLYGIADYDPTYESEAGASLPYGGYLNRSRGCYEMDITGYMQRLFNYVNTLEKLEDYDTSLVSRSIYIGPEALSPFTLKYTVLQGSTAAKSPIHLEMTYTMIK